MNGDTGPMRMDALIATAFRDPKDLRALLLSASPSELAALRAKSGAAPDADADRLAMVIEKLASSQLPTEMAARPALGLAVWAARKLGCGSPQTFEEVDKCLVEADKAHGRDESDFAGSDVARLFDIATQLAHLRQRKTRRLMRWRPLLNRLIGHPQPVAAASSKTPSDEAEQPAGDDTGVSEDAIWKALKGAGRRLPLSVWEERLTEARKTLGRFNIIVAGRTGVGKTTLIGAIFGEEVGNTLMGRPRTRGRIWYPLEPTEADVLRLCDTEGLELERYEETLAGLRREIASRNASSDPFDHIHVAWLCIDEPSLTVQPGEEALVKQLTNEGVPVIAVLTKAGMAPSFQDTVREILTEVQAVIRVRAEPITIEGQTFPQMGLNELMDATQAVIPNSVEAAWNVASRNLKANVARCETTIRQAAAAAGAAGAAPIPLADAAGVFGVQVGMIITISLNMGVKLNRSDLRAMAVTLLGALGLTAGGRFIAGQVAKLVPGLGTIAGSALTGSTAAALTYGLGRAYLEYLRSFFEKNRRMPDADELSAGFRRYWSQWKNKYQTPVSPSDA